MNRLEKEASDFIKKVSMQGVFKGVYKHKIHQATIHVLRSTPRYVILKWSTTEVLRSVSIMNDYEKVEKITTLH